MADEKKKETGETGKKETKEDKSETTEKDTGDRDAASKKEGDRIPAVEEAKKAALDLKTENTRREKILEEEKKVLDRKESLNALGGGSLGGKSAKAPKDERTDDQKAIDYSDKVDRGEADPLKEDGYTK